MVKMETKFFLHETSRGVHELFFQLLKQPLGDPKAPWTDIVVKAEKDHVARYHNSYKRFKKEHPDFVLQWPDLDVVIAPAVAPEMTVTVLEPEVPGLLEASEHVGEKLEVAKAEADAEAETV
jgi:hypothetical protein